MKENYIPRVHSKFNTPELENSFVDKTNNIMGNRTVNYFLISGGFFDVKGFAYSAIRSWKGAAKPSEGDSGRRPLLEASFASLSVYLSSLLSLQSDFYYAYDEVKEILLEKKRRDLWEIISEKVPFMSLPPKEMYGEQQSPISPYFVIQQDEDLVLGELYPSVYLTNIIPSIKTRFFTFFKHQGYTAFGFFDSLPPQKNLGFEKLAKEMNKEGTAENLIKYVKNTKNLKEVLVALIHSHNNALLEQFLIEDYEALLKQLLGEET